MSTYPAWSYFPRSTAAPHWISNITSAFELAQTSIYSPDHKKMDSDQVLQAVRPHLEQSGWQIEQGKTKIEKIHRPVLFGDQGEPRVKYEIDGWHPEHKAVLEIESGRAIMGNAIYRDLIRTSLIQDAEYLILGARIHYSYGNIAGQNDYEKTREQLDAIYASGRLQLPFTGVCVIGW